VGDLLATARYSGGLSRLRLFGSTASGHAVGLAALYSSTFDSSTFVLVNEAAPTPEGNPCINYRPLELSSFKTFVSAMAFRLMRLRTC
jgi:hypothetical protein